LGEVNPVGKISCHHKIGLHLREAVAGYLGSSRGVNCSPDQIVIVSGVQQGLDLLACFLVKPGQRVGWKARDTLERQLPSATLEGLLILARKPNLSARSELQAIANHSEQFFVISGLLEERNRA
jgi:hypothetical protein